MAVGKTSGSAGYWRAIDKLVASSEVIIDRPKGTTHPRYPALVYPLDYGYLRGTISSDGSEIDCWAGSLGMRRVTGVMFTVDLTKRDMEAKLLLGCTPEEMGIVLRFQNAGPMSALLLVRDANNENLG